MVLELSPDAFTRLSRQVNLGFRIVLVERHRPLVAGRLSRYVRTLGYERFEDYLDYVEGDRAGSALSELVNRLSASQAEFNREPMHFEYFQKTLLPAMDLMPERDGDRLQVWVAGCACGEEPWMLAICLAEHYGALVHQRASILATDISAVALAHALEGVYSDETVARLPEHWRREYFDAVGDRAWRVKDRLRGLVLFRRLNLNRSAYPIRATMDAIFCRSVMLYYDQASREELAGRLHQSLRPSGCLFIGQGESLHAGSRFERVLPAVYRRRSFA